MRQEMMADDSMMSLPSSIIGWQWHQIEC